jgi:hypothetical protein
MVLIIGHIRNSQISVAGAGLSLGENHFLANSLTWKEFLTGLTTRFFDQLQLSSSKVRKKKRVKYRSGNGNNYNSVRHNTILVSTDMLGFIGKHRPTSLVTSFRGASKMQKSTKEA